MTKFVELPNEILLKIFYDPSVTVETLISLSNVCERFYYLCIDEEKLWKYKFKQRWPLALKKIESGKTGTLQFENWMKETENSMQISNKFEAFLNSLSFKLYNYDNIISHIFPPILELFNAGKFGSSIVFNEISWIIKDEKLTSETNLTKRYYAKKVLHEVNYCLMSQKLNEFFKLPPERQSLEKGFYYLAKGLFPEEFLHVEYEEVSSKLDELAYEVQSYLKTKNPNHPAVSIQLFSPDEPLENSKWSYEECCELFNCIRDTMNINDIFAKKDDIHNVFLNKLVTKMRQPCGYATIIFIAVKRRLGILLNTFYFVRMSFLKWRFSNPENNEFNDAFDEIYWQGVSERARIHAYETEFSINDFLISLAMNYFCATNDESFTDFQVTLLLHSLSQDYFGFVNRDVLEFCLNREIHLKTINETCEKLFKTWGRESIEMYSIKHINAWADHHLTNQRNEPKSNKPKNRMKGVDVRFAVGMIVRDGGYWQSYVIIGWDENLEDKKSKFYVHAQKYLKYKDQQPFYRVLSPNGSLDYIAQENLLLETKPHPIDNYKVGKYFKSFNGTYYLPNEGLRSEYPDDEEVIPELIEKLKVKIF